MFYFITYKPVDDITNKVSSEFEERFSPKDGISSEHKGIGFAVPIRTQVYAANKQMTKILAIAILFTLSSVNLAFALEKQHNSEVKRQVISGVKSSATKQPIKETEDPDLKLSIEELKKKYPISLLDEKKKNYKEGQKINIDDYSEAEIKAAFLNADKNFNNRKFVTKVINGIDSELEEVLVLNQQELFLIQATCEKLGVADTSELPKNQRVIQSFIFSNQIIRYSVYKYVDRETANCLMAGDPFSTEDRD